MIHTVNIIHRSSHSSSREGSQERKMNEEPSNRPPLVRKPSWRRQSQANKVLRWALFYEKESDILAGLGVYGQFRVHEVRILFTTYFE